MIWKKRCPGGLKGLWVLALGMLLAFAGTADARTVSDPADELGFFNTVADKLLRSTFSFGLTNIPVQTNGVFVYTPAVHRLLQLAANLRDASTTNFYPTVYRPILYRDPATLNVYITGYTVVDSVTGPSDPQLRAPRDITALPTGTSSNLNVYGIPWVIGVKKYMPNFNEFYAYNSLEVARKLQFSRQTAPLAWTGASKQLYSTNQLLIMSNTNHIGFSFWNSYSATYPGGTPVVYANDTITMHLSYGSYSYSPGPVQYSFNFVPNPWNGSAWNVSQPPFQRQPNPSSFVPFNFDFPFIHEAALDLDANGNPEGTGFKSETFSGDPNTLPVFPDFEEDTTNRIQAFILDGSHVIDYVQFYGPVIVRELGDDLADPNYISGNQTYMWSTNASGVGSPPTGVNWGVQNQITVSQTGNSIPPGSWQDPPNIPPGLQGIKLAEAADFKGFFQITWTYGGKTYQNTNLVQQAPYTPIRTVVSPTVWVVNDPLVHYLTTDLNQPTGILQGVTNGIAKSDDPAIPPVAIPNLEVVQSRYQPWGLNSQMNTLVGVLHDSPENASYNLSYRDPLVWSSDDWNFPATNNLPLTTLGQVHRGTPWQTIYLKSANLLSYVDPTQVSSPYVGWNTWANWTGDFDTNDASVMAPTADWRLAALLTAMFNTNDATQLVSVNSGNWPQLLDGITTYTNITTNPTYTSSPQYLTALMSSNSPQAAYVAAGIANASMSQPNQQFVSVGDILSTPELSTFSPWLDLSDAFSPNDRIDYDLSDEAYEAIPSQLLPKLRPDSNGTFIYANGTWNAQFSGVDGFNYTVQTSSNLVDWVTVCTNQPVQGVLIYPVTQSGGGARQFYRSVLLP